MGLKAMIRCGLALAGGGGKGAYQIGVLKALCQLGFTPDRFAAVAGSSVGALNLALFVQNDLEKAEQVWLSITSDQIFSIDVDAVLAALLRSAPLTAVVKSRVSRRLLALASHGVFSRAGLMRLMAEHLNPELIKRHASGALFAACVQIPSLKAKYLRLDGVNVRKITDILLASSAIPLFFKPVKIDGQYYIDGGVLDNLPIRPLYELGCELIFAVHLSRRAVVNHSRFPGARILEIVPQEDLGSMCDGTLDFTTMGIRRRIELGYRDGMRIVRKALAFAPMAVGVVDERLGVGEGEQWL
ncbi:MAG TPA: patatin-like phospholipase family protein [Limnochordia bacterium]|nr:patatin-like phospholipase family protein [Limnochordia bacterium]HPZ31116.1 patatin-like phospholipase family protein [Limnochordia bacterium]HQD70717.1 patatin-like phospholipase family protein [Limnochordia bacterium]